MRLPRERYTTARLFVAIRKTSGTWVVEVCDSYGVRSRNATPHFFSKKSQAMKQANRMCDEMNIELFIIK